MDTATLAASLRAGDRRALARAITLCESTRPDHRAAAEALLAAVLPATGGALRIGISGVPGVGKSTFIESLGCWLVEQGRRVAVLAVDPSSQRGGGAILGDKTRMDRLTRLEAAFVRPSPSGTQHGGVARRTREALLLCEAAGYDVVLVETVGVGQAETAVAAMTDAFVLLLLPGGGDELQGIKRGIMELADIVVVNKADGPMLAQARHTAADYRHALGLMRRALPDWKVPVLQCSALEGTGVAELWAAVEDLHRRLAEGGRLAERRAEQARDWLWQEVEAALLAAFRADPAVAAALPSAELGVTAGRETPPAAARRLIEAFGRKA
ncbi:MAG TPA: methylmalonyl Co-A mutase-associated GTPase MeaB [Alphaproteobacteria bacterium]|nr:methylmalonyl Co-A mutase-associated GTPase MeaB [Alphaproteobacteria bacterium]